MRQNEREPAMLDAQEAVEFAAAKLEATYTSPFRGDSYPPLHEIGPALKHAATLRRLAVALNDGQTRRESELPEASEPHPQCGWIRTDGRGSKLCTLPLGHGELHRTADGSAHFGDRLCLGNGPGAVQPDHPREALDILGELTSEERLEVFGHFCAGCGAVKAACGCRPSELWPGR